MKGDDFYISERLVMQLEELHKYIEKYQLNCYSCKALGALFAIITTMYWKIYNCIKRGNELYNPIVSK